jgi:hypothetical protein
MFGLRIPMHQKGNPTSGNVWNVGTNPQMTYDWIKKQWTVPLYHSVGKKTKVGSTG